MATQEEMEKLIEMRANGYSYQAIADELGKAKSTVVSWAQDLEVEVQILDLQEFKKDSLVRKYKATEIARFEQKLIQFDKIKKELEERDYSDVSTDKLMALYEKLEADVKYYF